MGQLSLDYQPSSVTVNGMDIYETSMTHSHWGLVNPTDDEMGVEGLPNPNSVDTW